jgi:transposase-like protein
MISEAPEQLVERYPELREVVTQSDERVSYADGLRRRRPRTGDKWHLDKVFLKINGVQHYLSRAVDQNGVVLDILVQTKS